MNFIEFLLFGSHVHIDCIIDKLFLSNFILLQANTHISEVTDNASQRNKNGTKRGSPEKPQKMEEGCQPSFILSKYHLKSNQLTCHH